MNVVKIGDAGARNGKVCVCVGERQSTKEDLNWFSGMVFIVLGVVTFDMLAWSCSFRLNLSRLVHLHRQNS